MGEGVSLVRRMLPHGSTPTLLSIALACAAAGGCKPRTDSGSQTLVATTASATTPASSGVASQPSASVTATPEQPIAAAAPIGGVKAFAQIETVKSCQVRTRDLEANLATGAVGLASKGNDVAFSWLYRGKGKGEGLLAFGGYDTQGRLLAAGHGLGKGALFAPRVFPSGDGWSVAWFDQQSLVFARATWSPLPNPVGRLAAVTTEVAEHTAIAPTSGGQLLATAPLAGGQQLGLFQFTPSGDGADTVKAIGATHHANHPEHPALAELNDGYVIAWQDTPEGKLSAVQLSRFDAGGRELGAQISLSTPGRAASHPSLVTTASGVLVTWVEHEGEASAVVVRSIDRSFASAGPAHHVDAGSAPLLIAMKDGGATLGFLRTTDNGPSHLAAVHVSDDGKPAERGVIVSEPGRGKGGVALKPAAATGEDGRVIFGYLYNDGMRAQLRSLAGQCLTEAPSP